MFHQFKVAEDHIIFLRFFWWKDGDSAKSPVEYRMTVHLFGTASSPGFVNYGLKQIAQDHETNFGTNAANFVKHDFDVDDGRTSVDTKEHAISLVEKKTKQLSKGGSKSSSTQFCQRIDLKSLDLGSDPLPLERTLGVQWCVASDAFKLPIIVQDNPFTSAVFSLRFVLSMTLLGSCPSCAYSQTNPSGAVPR